MNATERQAVAEVLESYFQPDSPEALAFAMYQLRRIFNLAQSTKRKHYHRDDLPPLPKTTSA
jgi:hypothetical protein